MPKLGPMPVAMASLVALVAIAGSHASRAAADECLAAPNGPTPKGQHWYYHLDHAKHRKCWYLRAVTAAAAPAATVSRQADDTVGPAKPSATSAPAQRAETPQPPADSPAAPNKAAVAALPRADDASAATTGPTLKNARTVAPAGAAVDSGAGQNAAAVWPDPPPPAAAGVKEADAAAAAAVPDSAAPTAKTAPPAPAAANTAPPPAPAQADVAARNDTPPASAAAPVNTASSALADNALVVVLAAVVALGAFALFFVVGRRKRVRAVHAEPGDFAPRFGSKPDRRSLFRLPDREAPPLQAAPIQSSLVPEQVAMTRRSAPPR